MNRYSRGNQRESLPNSGAKSLCRAHKEPQAGVIVFVLYSGIAECIAVERYERNVCRTTSLGATAPFEEVDFLKTEKTTSQPTPCAFQHRQHTLGRGARTDFSAGSNC